jgi:hypothetical protein
MSTPETKTVDYQSKQTPEWVAPRNAIIRGPVPTFWLTWWKKARRNPREFPLLKRKSDTVIKMENSPHRASLIFELIFIGD